MGNPRTGVSTGYFTWNPVLHFHLMRGGVADFDEQVRSRTTKFTLVDRALGFDTIEWQLNNDDGLLFMPEYVALGVTLGVRMGYAGSLAPWRYFVINRIKGEPGSRGTPDQAVGGRGAIHKVSRGSQGHIWGAQVTYFGRSRNARAPKKASSGKGKKVLGPTADMVNLDLALMNEGPRVFPGDTLAEAVTGFAAAHGFTGPLAQIEESNDQLDGGRLTIHESMPDGEFMKSLAAKKGWLFYIDETGFHFHSRSWRGVSVGAHREYVVGGPDVLKVTIDGDFRLPLPKELKTKGLDPIQRHVNEGSISSEPDTSSRYFTPEPDSSAWPPRAVEQGSRPPTRSLGEFVYKSFPLPADQIKNLVRNYVLPVSQAGTTASAKAVKNFSERILQKYKLTIDVVGDPIVRATNHINLSGTGTPFVDGTWYADEVKQQFSGSGGQTYVTTVTLKPIPKPVVAAPRWRAQHSNEGGGKALGEAYFKGMPGTSGGQANASALRPMGARVTGVNNKVTPSEGAQPGLASAAPEGTKYLMPAPQVASEPFDTPGADTSSVYYNPSTDFSERPKVFKLRNRGVKP